MDNSTYNSSRYKISTGTRLETSSSYKICKKVVEEILKENPKEEKYAIGTLPKKFSNQNSKS